jgi:undecaprenyl-diphosphatase
VCQIYDEIITTILLAIVQGITEWLPVSSSGHLVIAQEWLGLELPLVFDIMLHVGTLCVIIVVFWKDIGKMVVAIVKLDFRREEGKLALFIAVGSIPTALIGFFFHDVFESFFHNVLAVGIAFLITGLLLHVSERQKGERRLNYLDSLLTGIAQGVSIIPGISRSGLTIATGLLRKVEKETAFKYSFLLSMPAIIGATITESRELIIGDLNLLAIFIGVVTSFSVGYVFLKVLKKIVVNEKFHLFAYYCWTVGAIVVLLHFFQ